MLFLDLTRLCLCLVFCVSRIYFLLTSRRPFCCCFKYDTNKRAFRMIWLFVIKKINFKAAKGDNRKGQSFFALVAVSAEQGVEQKMNRHSRECS